MAINDVRAYITCDSQSLVAVVDGQRYERGVLNVDVSPTRECRYSLVVDGQVVFETTEWPARIEAEATGAITYWWPTPPGRKQISAILDRQTDAAPARAQT